MPARAPRPISFGLIRNIATRRERRRRTLALLAGLAVGLHGPRLSLAVDSWVGGSGSWSDGANWASGAVPGQWAFISITSSDSDGRTVSYDGNGVLTYNTVQIDNNGGGSTTFVMSQPGTSLTSYYEGVGESTGTAAGRADFIQSAGTNTITYGEINVGTYAGHVGTYTLSGTGVLNTTLGGREVIGMSSGRGSFIQTGGTNSLAGKLTLGDGRGIGNYSLSGNGKLTTNNTESIGSGGTGAFVQTGGTNTAHTLFIGSEYNSSTGSYSLSSGTFTVSGSATVGSQYANCSGALSVIGGQLAIQGSLTVRNSPSTRVDISGGSLTASSTMNQGTININGGTVQLGSLTGTGTLSVNGKGISLTFPALQQSVVNVWPGGTVRITGGTANSIGFLGLTGSAVVDLTGTKLIINYSGRSNPKAMIRGYLASGYNGGKWNGPGVSSSYVAGLNKSQPALVHCLGFADSADGVVSGLPSGQIEIMPTVAGDALLLGNVNYNDFLILQQNFGTSGWWDKGDFDYSGIVDFNDFKLLVQDFSNDSSLTPAQLEAMNSLAGQFETKLVANVNSVGFKLVAIPEPGLAGVVLVSAAAFVMRRGGLPKRQVKG